MSVGTRFANFIVDLIVVYLIVFLVSMMLALVIPGFAELVAGESEGAGAKILEQVIGMLVSGLIYTCLEGAMKGRSVGKLITGTIAVREDGQPFGWGDALRRGFSRIVPFEPLSALGGHPWHDKWTKTLVVKKDSLPG